MREYTYDELQQMQEKALERVRNMQMYSKSAVEGTNAQNTARDGNASYSRTASSAPQNDTPPQSPPHKSGRIKMPLNLPEERDLVYPSFKEHFAPETEKTKQQAEQKHKANLLDTVLQEPDEAILFSLLLLLKSEGADEALMMALLYIMS
ncbi:MAG: hypothetical protein ACI4K9_08510 [Candidatus Fimenecus sp.]